MTEILKDLLNDDPDALLEDFKRCDYEAREIAQSEEIHTVWLTKIDSCDKRPKFSEDVRGEKHVQWRELRCNRTLHDWIRIEYKLFKRPFGRRQHQLVAARWPYHNGWVVQVKFKPSRRDAIEDHVPPDGIGQNKAVAIQWVDALSFDYWETRTGILTAGVSRPKCLDWSDRPRNVHQNAYTLLGICEDFQKCFDSIKNSDEVRELVRMTRAGTIRFGHADNSKSSSGKPPRLDDELKVQCEYLIDLSICQALAGPKGDTSQWCGKPVVELVNSIYRDTLNRQNRKVRRRNSEQAAMSVNLDQLKISAIDDYRGRTLLPNRVRADEERELWFNELEISDKQKDNDPDT